MKPPLQIPPDLYDSFTLNRLVKVEYRYIDNSSFTIKNKFFYKKDIDNYIERIRKGENFYYGRTDEFLRKAINKYPINNKTVGIIGSQKPLYESFVLAYGGIPITIDYHKILTDDKRLTLYTVKEYEINPVKFDSIISISSIEHDGLGRYGDPVNPVGDIEAMTKIRDMLNDDGIFFLSVPVGKDKLVWNAHRIYGRLRLPLLLKKWEILKVVGYPFYIKLLKRERQPVFVLKKKL